MGQKDLNGKDFYSKMYTALFNGSRERTELGISFDVLMQYRQRATIRIVGFACE